MQPSQTPGMSTNVPPPSTSTPLQQRRARPGPWPPVPPPNDRHSTATGSTTMLPHSWAKKTGFKGTMSGESNVTDSGLILPPNSSHIDLESGPHTPKTLSSFSAPASAAIVTTTAAAAATDHNNARIADDILKNPAVPSAKDPPVKKRKDSNGHVRFDDAPSQPQPPPPPPTRTGDEDHHRHHASLPQLLEDEHFLPRRSHIKYELRDRPGLVPIAFYGLQHYLSMLGSLILLPLVIVPAMGGTQDDTSTVVSTVLLVSGITTLLHTSFGTRLPLVQGPSFVYLAPVLAIINTSEFLGLSNNNFKHVMKELQGAIIISSAFQAIMGYTGFMSILLRFINPVVVSPTIAAVGLSFFSYGFTRVSMCLEIGIVQILLVVILSLYLRKISVFGHRVFLIYTVPLGLGITWAVAFLLTEIGAYSYEGCDINVPPSNTVSDYCRKHVSRMKHCRVDTYHVLKSSPWIRVPLPLQWGMPILNWKMVLVMCVVSIIASVDSVGSYHASSLLVASRPPTAGVLSRGIGLEGFSSVLAGLWGTGTGSTTLTENVHTIAVTKMGSRRGVEVGAFILIVLSFVGKVGGFIASIPDVIVAGLLCFMWAMLAALGLSNLRYSEAGSSRNVIIVGLSLFFSLSIPSYFQQYGTVPNGNSSVPSYFQPYTVGSHGPFHGKYSGVNYVMNTLLSLHMVIAFIIAVILDNTVPGSRQERGVYVWSETEAARREPTVAKDYELPFRVGRMFRWVKWVGL